MFSCGPRAGRRTGHYAFGVPRTASDEVGYGKKTYMIPMQNRRIWIGNLVPQIRQCAGRYFPQLILLAARGYSAGIGVSPRTPTLTLLETIDHHTAEHEPCIVEQEGRRTRRVRRGASINAGHHYNGKSGLHFSDLANQVFSAHSNWPVNDGGIKAPSRRHMTGLLRIGARDDV